MTSWPIYECCVTLPVIELYITVMVWKLGVASYPSNMGKGHMGDEKNKKIWVIYWLAFLKDQFRRFRWTSRIGYSFRTADEHFLWYCSFGFCPETLQLDLNSSWEQHVLSPLFPPQLHADSFVARRQTVNKQWRGEEEVEVQIFILTCDWNVKEHTAWLFCV